MISKIVNLTSQPQYYQAYENIMEEIWPIIILKSDIVDEYFNKLFKIYPNFQKVCLNEKNEVIGFINTIPIYWDQPLHELPEEGWDWLMQKGIKDFENGIKPNCLGGLQIGISKKYQGHGLSRKIIAIGKSLQQENEFKHFILPIRPTLKHLQPKMPMEEYMNIKENGKIYDPWIRIHTSEGAEIIKVCHQSMVISGTISEWESWGDIEIKASGNYVIKGALNEVKMELDAPKSSYEEDNIWLYYKLNK